MEIQLMTTSEEEMLQDLMVSLVLILYWQKKKVAPPVSQEPISHSIIAGHREILTAKFPSVLR